MPALTRILVAWLINGAALWVANALFDGVRIHGWWAYIIGAAVLGIANAVLKPVLALLTLPLIIVTLGLFLLVITLWADEESLEASEEAAKRLAELTTATVGATRVALERYETTLFDV